MPHVLLQFTLLLLLLISPNEASPVASRHTLASSTVVANKRPENPVFRGPPEAVSVVISHNDNEVRLQATFSRSGTNYETKGLVAQVSMFRACEAKQKGLDTTLREHVAVVFVDEVPPFLTGCVALENQARFAERSGALALIVGPANRVDKNELAKARNARIPVVIVEEGETKKLREALDGASRFGRVANVAVVFPEVRASYTLRLHVFRPTLLNLALIGILIILVVFITLLVFVKIRWRSDSHRDIWLRTLARSALNKMEIRKFEKVPTSETKERMRVARLKQSNNSFLPVFGSLSSVAHTITGQERCSICLDEYAEGAELRVLFCGHEFHPKCVDQWVLTHRRCPLCQFDVVYKEYPQSDGPSPQIKPSTRTLGTSTESPLETPLLAGGSSSHSFVEPMPTSNSHHLVASPRRLKPEQSQGSPRASASSSRARSSSAPRRRPLRPRHILVPTLPPPPPPHIRVSIGSSNAHAQPIGTISGYSSDVSSYPDGPALVDDFGVPKRIPL